MGSVSNSALQLILEVVMCAAITGGNSLISALVKNCFQLTELLPRRLQLFVQHQSNGRLSGTSGHDARLAMVDRKSFFTGDHRHEYSNRTEPVQ